MESKEFEKLIDSLPQTLSVLDVGGGGLHGENTTNALLHKFGASQVTCVCSSAKELNTYRAQLDEKHITKPVFIEDDFYKLTPSKYDLVVLDLNIENNLNDWSDAGLKRMISWLNHNGYIVSYIMATDQYGNDDTSKLINEHWQKYWGNDSFDIEASIKKLKSLPGWKLIDCIQEVRRPYIYWALLQKND